MTEITEREHRAFTTMFAAPGSGKEPPVVVTTDVITRVRDTLSRAQTAGIGFITPEDPEWPAGLADLEHPPAGLWVRGHSLIHLDQSIAIVGSRAATGYGEHVAKEIAEGLVRDGHAVVSGGAYGIDAAAHRAAITVGGRTYAFLAGGVDRMYPAGHVSLAEQIIERGGALVSEVPPGAAPTRWRFLARNRLIAAVSQATVVVEAGLRSGTLNTVGHAGAMKRPVGAVPGPITSPASAGAHRIISNGTARLVTSAEDVLEMVA